MQHKMLPAFVMTVSVLFIFLLRTESLTAQPLADIKANNFDDNVSITTHEILNLSIALNTGSSVNIAADWWAACRIGENWYSYIYPSGWQAGLAPAYQGPLVDLPSTPIFSGMLPVGAYTCYFAVDSNMNGTLDYDSLHYDQITVNVTPSTSTQILQPNDFQYLGAFRLPGGDMRPETFTYGGNAMTFNPDGDAEGSGDGFPGSLFITGHDRMPYGELSNGSQMAEISIPIPVISKNINDLNQSQFLQNFQNVAQNLFVTLDEIPRIGIQYLNRAETGPKIHLAWGQHFQENELTAIPSHAWIDVNLSNPNPQGTWFIGNQSLYSVNGYLFEIPASWADTYAANRYLATGRFRDGGWSGQGPALFAYRPWIDAVGTPAPSGTRLEETPLLLYASSIDSDNVIERSLNHYQHADEWEGGAWIITTTGKSAVLFAGTKGTGAKYWYGWRNPAGPEFPCIETEFLGQFPLCRLADGTSCPAEDLTGCEGHNDYRGWWSSSFDAQFILYNPDDLAEVVAGNMSTWEPQPYVAIDIDEHLFLNPPVSEEEALGQGVQRRYRIGAVAYDQANNLLYVLELFADEAKPVVHVWRMQ